MQKVLSIRLLKFFEKFWKKWLTSGGESAILCKLSDARACFRGLEKKFPGDGKKGLTSETGCGKLIKLSEARFLVKRALKKL